MCADGMDRSGLPITEGNDAVREVSRDLEKTARLARWFGLGLIFIGVMAMLVTSFVTIYVGAQVRSLVRQAVAEQDRLARDAEREAQLVGDIMGCILGQFAEHRAASREHYDAQAQAHGQTPVTVPSPEPVDHQAVMDYCSRARGAFEPPPNPVPAGGGGGG